MIRGNAGAACLPGTAPAPVRSSVVTAEAQPTPTDPRHGWLDPDEQRLWRQLLAVHSRLMCRLDEELRAGHGISLADYDVLVALAEAPGGALRMRELAGRVMLSPSGLTRRVDGLLGRGLVARQLCPSDGRGALATLTAGGRQLLAAAAPTHVGGVRRYLLDPLGPTTSPGLRRALGEIDRAIAERASIAS